LIVTTPPVTVPVKATFGADVVKMVNAGTTFAVLIVHVVALTAAALNTFPPTVSGAIA